MRFILASGIVCLSGRPQCYRPSPKSHKPMAPSCCSSVSARPFQERVNFCFEQNENSFPNCRVHAFILVTASQKIHCVDPAAKWLRRRFQRLQNNGICCQIL
uniref:Chemokine interleukin-8-like domain-containing protein n=1 Tax=Salarias fasciatus TaxID=181472 RepID=A0A672IRH8_SALFA